MNKDPQSPHKKPKKTGTSAATTAELNVAHDVANLYRDGIVALPKAFTREWTEQMKEDIMDAFWKAIQRPKGVLSRGPRRWYVEINPQELSGFVDLVTHPWVTQMCEQVLGKGYKFVELGFDIPFQGAKDQPWHRDFPSPAETYEEKKIVSVAFNMTGVDVTADMGALEITHGTQFEDGREWKDQMFPPREEWARYKANATRKYPQMGDISCRSDMTIHRGTHHPSPIPRPVLVLGADSNGATGKLHGPKVTREFWLGLPEDVKQHLLCEVVEEDALSPVVQVYEIEGLCTAAE